MQVLTDEREKFISFAEIPDTDADQVLVAYSLTEFTGFADHWVIAFYDEDNGAYVTTWCGEDYRADPIWDASYADTEGDGKAQAKAAAFCYALGRKES